MKAVGIFFIVYALIAAFGRNFDLHSLIFIAFTVLYYKLLTEEE